MTARREVAGTVVGVVGWWKLKEARKDLLARLSEIEEQLCSHSTMRSRQSRSVRGRFADERVLLARGWQQQHNPLA